MFRKLINEHIKQSGDSLNMVARKVGVSKSTVYLWAEGTRTPSKLSVQKVCQGLGWDSKTEARLLGMFENPNRKPTFKRNTLTDEFWELLWELEAEFPKGLRFVPEDDERLIRIRELVGARASSSTTGYAKQRVEELRIEHGYHGYEISHLMGYSRSWYSGTFMKNDTFTDIHARKLAEIFDVDVSELVREDD